MTKSRGTMKHVVIAALFALGTLSSNGATAQDAADDVVDNITESIAEDTAGDLAADSAENAEESAAQNTAEGDMSLEELEKLVEQQRIALEEAIASRESTKARAAAVRARLSESEERKQAVEEELLQLCESQENVQPGTFDRCMNSPETLEGS